MLRQIQYFIAVVETGSFSRAADKCHISQSAISQQIKALEDNLGVKLLEKQGRSFVVTEAGQYFFRYGKKLVKQADTLVWETRKLAGNEEAPFSIGYLRGIDTKPIVSAIRQMKETYPELEFRVVTSGHETLYNGLEDGTLDIAVNDQRRKFSDSYHNLILRKEPVYPKGKTSEDLPCILVAAEQDEEEEKTYWQKIGNIASPIRFARSREEADLLEQTGLGWTLSTENTESAPVLERTLCAFWKGDRFSTDAFAHFLKAEFDKKN